MCPSTAMKKALILVPCSGGKQVVPFKEKFQQPVHGIQPLRGKLLREIEHKPSIASKPKNQAGILNRDAPLSKAIDLYTGQFYQAEGNSLRGIMAGEYPSIGVLIVSAFYGLAKPGEGLKEYELKMDDTLNSGVKVCKFWQEHQLWRLLRNYIDKNNITYIWSLLPNSYHCVFDELWKQMGKDKCFRVKVVPNPWPKPISYVLGQWLGEVLKEISGSKLDYLTGELLPKEFEKIPGYTFHYVPC